MLTPRQYQLDAVENAREEIRAGRRRVLIVAPTGAGKTVIASHIIHSAVQLGSRVLFVAHRREIINQTYQKLLAAGLPETQVGVVMANDPRRRPGARVQVGSIDTLRNRAKPTADLLFVDECHRVLAKSYLDLLSAYPEAISIGLTATPYRIGGAGLGDVYESMVVVSTVRRLISEGYLVEPRVWTVPAAQLPDLSDVRLSKGDYNETQLAEAVVKPQLVGDIVSHWQRKAEGRRTVAFAVSVAHSRLIAEQFREAGVPAEHLDGGMGAEERDMILARLDSGVTRVVSNCGVLVEGWDQPAVKCLIMARPTASLGLWIQCAGRILRPCGDQTALILDHSGNAMRHGLPQDEREFSLDSKKRKAKDAPVRTCPECYAVFPAAVRKCPSCGAEFAAPERKELEHKPGELVELTPEQHASQKRGHWEWLCRTAQKKNYQPGWVFYRFKDKWGHPPPKGWSMREFLAGDAVRAAARAAKVPPKGAELEDFEELWEES